MTTVEEEEEEEERTQARIDGLLQVLRDAESDFRRSYARVLDVVAELDAEKAGAVAGFGTTTRLLAGVLNLTKAEAKARAEQAGLLAPRRSLIGETLPPALPATATELAAGAIGPTHVRVITATMRRPHPRHTRAPLPRPSRPWPPPPAGSTLRPWPGSVSGCSPTSTPTARHPPTNPKPSVSCESVPAPTAP